MGSRTIGIVAHVDAGKTTLSEQMLYLSGALRTAGRVDHGSTALDAAPIERARGITVFSDQADFTWKGVQYTLMDTPGHVDFAAEVERALLALDAVILLADASEPLKPHGVMLAELAKRRGLPILLFLNKCDLAGAMPETVMQTAAKRLGMECVPLPPDPELVAQLDEAFLERYLAEDWTQEDCVAALRRAFESGLALPVTSGAALQGQGVEALLDALNLLLGAPKPQKAAPFRGTVYKVRRDEKGRRIVFLRVESGELRSRMALEYADGSEKLQELRAYCGKSWRLIEHASAGDAVGAVGLSQPVCGDLLEERNGALVVAGHTGFRLEPALAARVEADDGTPQPTLLEKLRLLEDEDPQLHIRHLPQTGELLAQVMGPVQLEILEELLRERFNIRARFSKPDVLYRETLCAPVMGYGHYEPLRHYAEVQFRLEPAPRGSGISFASECHVDNLPVNYQKLIQTHVFERTYRGVLTGSPIADIRMVLAAGRAHLKHTEGGDFREATSRAIRQGLMSGQCMLLEPWYAFDLMVPAASVGRVLSDISAMFGTVTAQETLGDMARIQGRGPVSEFADYSVQLRAVTHGEGGGSFQLDGYEPCHNQEDVIARMGYDPCADTEQTPNSVICRHGAGYTVLWNEAKAHMHCEIEKR